MKKLILSFILATICGISAFAQWYHWEVCESGQELKYIISGNETQGYKARITYARSGENGDYNSPGAKTGDLIIPSSVTYNGFTCPVYRIDDHAFDGCSRLTSVTIPNSVTSIGYSAFSGCSGLTSVTISNSVTSIENSAFNNCTGLTRVNYTGGVADWCEISFSTNPLNYAHNLYINNNLVTDLVIPNTVTEIKQFAFLGATCLTTITIPNSVTSIGDGAFYGCSGLTGTLTIPNSVTSIGSSAFWGCSGLSGALTIPNSVTSIEFSVFSGCSGLTEITIPNSVTSIGSYAFYGCSGLTEITIPNSVTSIGSAAFGGCRNLTSMTIPFVGGSATATESSASTCFGYIFGTTSYNGGSAAAQIYNSNLNPTVTYYIPSSLRSVSVTGGSLYTGAFSKCSRLTSVTLLDSITEIPKYTFYYCSGLASITIPNSVTSIGMSAFNNCSGLTNIYANPTTPPTIYYVSTFSSYTATVWVPCGSAAAYSAAYGWSNFSEIRERFPYTLNVSSADLSMGTASVTQQPTCTDATAVITATPNNGYAFQQWNDGNTDNPRTINVSDDGEYIAYFGALYTITLTSADETMGTVSGGGTYINGEQVEISAVANEHYHFVQWNDGNTDNPRTITVTGNATYTATFAIDQFSITVESDNVNMGNVSGSGTYGYGSEIQISATPAEHHHFTQWNDGNDDNPRTITVTEDATYTAEFAIDHFTVTVLANNDEMGIVSGGGTYDYGTEIQISATASEHYLFVQWNDGNDDNPRTITVTSDSTFTAVFAINQHTVTVVSADTEMGTVSESGTYDYGSEIQISATPADGYGFVAWNDGNTDNPRTVIVTEDITYTATFGAWRTVTVASTNETEGTVEGTGEYVEGTTIQITAIPNEHYHFVHWIDEENPTRDFNTDNPRTITVTGNMTYTAVFAIDQHTITVESADEAMGTVSESNTYDYGAEIQISATAAEHYHFVQWSDGNTDNPRTITVTGDATYIATFAPNNYTIVVRSLNEDWGTVSEGGTFPYGTEIQISATPRENYAFVAWTDGNTDNPRTITVVADAEYTATFTWSVGIDETAVSEIALFPNPATDILNITSSETISEIEIVNVMGQVVKRIEVNADNAVCDVEDLTSGVYVVRIYGNPCTSTGSVSGIMRKFVKE